jgi:hypothetical protein
MYNIMGQGQPLEQNIFGSPSQDRFQYITLPYQELFMQQQVSDYDLLAVFPDEQHAEAATAKLRKEGFGDSEVFQLAAGAAGKGEFREHGPNRNRREVFLRTERTGPNLLLVVLLAIALGIVIGGIGFALPLLVLTLHLAFFGVAEPITGIAASALGIIIGAIIGLSRGGRVRGAIGQDTAKASTSSPVQGARTMVALRFADRDNTIKNSKARAILINNEGKIDRSIGRRE